MRVLFSTCSSPQYMAPPQLADEQVNCGPFFQDREIAGRFVSLATPKGEYDLAAVAARLPSDQQPEVVVCLVDASWFNQPKNLAAFKCPKVVLVADTHHMNKPVTGMISYLQTQVYDRIVFLYTRHHLDFFRAAGLKNVFWFPGLTFPHSDATVRAARREKREHRIALIGQSGNLHQRRLKLAGALAGAGLPLVFREAPQREALAFYGDSLLGFNATANSDLNLRAFETMAAGAGLLMDRLAPAAGLEQLWRDGREFAGYDSAEELVERARHLVAHPDEARAIGAAGARWFDENFNAARRRADFAALVFDGREVPAFALPARPAFSAAAFGASLAHFAPALGAYEYLQKLHSTSEGVRVLADDTVPAEFARVCATLPRLHVVRKLAPGETADCFVTSQERALALTALNAPRFWCWDTTTADLPALAARFKAAGLLQLREDLALFGLAEVESGPVPDRRALEARKLLHNCDLAAAFEKARQALDENPDSLEGYLVMAELALEHGKTELFRKMTAKARQLNPAEPRLPLLELAARQPGVRQGPAERLLAAATRHLSAQDLMVARQAAARALKLDPKLPAAWYWLGQIALRLAERTVELAQWREFGAALKFLRGAAELAPERPDYWFELGHALRRGGLLSEAAAALAHALERDPADALGWFALGETFLAQDDEDRAAEAFARGLEHAPSDRHLLLWLGHARKRQGRVTEAVDLHRRAHGAGPARRIARASGRQCVVFLVQHGPSWPGTESVWRAFAADPAWEAIVVALPYQHPFYNRTQDDTDAIFGFLRDNAVPHVRWDEFPLGPDFADVVFFQNPYDVTRPAGWRTPDLLRLVPRLAYIPYGIEIGGGAVNAGFQFNQPVQQLAWAVFARSERHRAMFARHCCGGAGHVHVTGHPKLDAQRDLPAVRDPELTRFASGRRVVLWNPQFDVRLNGTRFGAGFSTFLRWHEELPGELAARPGLAFIIRPHPLFFGTLEDRGILTRSQVQAWLDRCTAAGNILIDRRPSYLPAFAAADAMLSDASSFLLEFAGTGKPLLYLHNPHGPALNEDGVFIREHCATAETRREISDFLDDVAADRDPHRASRLAAYPKYLHLPPGGAGAAIKRVVEERLAAEHPPAAAVPEEGVRRAETRDFWVNCRDTHLGSRDYYVKAAQALATRLPRLLGAGDRVIDVGCGNGEMTLLAAPHCAAVTGYDVSSALVTQARAAAARAGTAHARFAVLDLARGVPEEPAEAILCLGVFSCVHDDTVWLAALDRFARILPENGLLILRETVSPGARQAVRYPNGYYACYRARDEYLAAVRARGFGPVEEEHLQTNPQGLENHLWVFRRAAESGAVAVEAAAAALV